MGGGEREREGRPRPSHVPTRAPRPPGNFPKGHLHGNHITTSVGDNCGEIWKGGGVHRAFVTDPPPPGYAAGPPVPTPPATVRVAPPYWGHGRGNRPLPSRGISSPLGPTCGGRAQVSLISAVAELWLSNRNCPTEGV